MSTTGDDIDVDPFAGLVFDDGEGESPGGAVRPDWAGKDWLDGARYFATGKSEEQAIEDIRAWAPTVRKILLAAVERATRVGATR